MKEILDSFIYPYPFRSARRLRNAMSSQPHRDIDSRAIRIGGGPYRSDDTPKPTEDPLTFVDDPASVIVNSIADGCPIEGGVNWTWLAARHSINRAIGKLALAASGNILMRSRRFNSWKST